MNTFDCCRKLITVVFFPAISFISHTVRFNMGNLICGAAQKMNVHSARNSYFNIEGHVSIFQVGFITVFRSLPAFCPAGTTLITSMAVRRRSLVLLHNQGFPTPSTICLHLSGEDLKAEVRNLVIPCGWR